MPLGQGFHATLGVAEDRGSGSWAQGCSYLGALGAAFGAHRVLLLSAQELGKGTRGGSQEEEETQGLQEGDGHWRGAAPLPCCPVGSARLCMSSIPLGRVGNSTLGLGGPGRAQGMT